MAAKCSATTRRGIPCGSPPLPGSALCWLHDPNVAEQRREASRKGGKARSNAARAKKALPAEIMTDAELLSWLGVMLKRVMAGATTPAIGNSVATIAKAMVAVRQASELEDRLAELEQRAGIDERRGL